MPQLLKPYNPWFIGIEAGLAAALVSAGMGDNLSLGSAVGVAVVIGGWNYYVQKNYPVPRALVERAERLEFKKLYRKDYRADIKAGETPALAAYNALVEADAQLHAWNKF
jgi:hypothetical protein